MHCIVEHSVYSFINGREAIVDVDLKNGLLEVLVDQGHGPERYVVAKNEVRFIADPVGAADLPF